MSRIFRAPLRGGFHRLAPDHQRHLHREVESRRDARRKVDTDLARAVQAVPLHRADPERLPVVGLLAGHEVPPDNCSDAVG